ncbi:MAG: Uma2 family endonuclease [Pyrinomonadaceae bacterium]
MSSISATQSFTADELLKMPREGYRYELIEGALKKMSPAGSEHGVIAATIASLLWQHVRANKLGMVLAAETGYKTASDPDTVIAPDTSFISQEQVDRIGRTEKFWPGAPDLAVEVVSHGEPAREVREKVAVWLAAGTQRVWVVDAKKRTINIHRKQADVAVLTEKDMLDGADVVHGFKCKVAEVFA